MLDSVSSNVCLAISNSKSATLARARVTATPPSLAKGWVKVKPQFDLLSLAPTGRVASFWLMFVMNCDKVVLASNLAPLGNNWLTPAA